MARDGRRSDEEAFTAFWALERDRLYRVLAVGLGDHVLAAEAIDEAMARALQRWATVSGYDDPAGWVLRVARNWATSWHRKWTHRRPTVPAEDLDRAVRDATPDVDVHRVLADLPEATRTLLVLRHELDWPVTRIAAALDLPEGTVKSRLSRAHARLAADEEALR